ncbi:MAG: XRE family transcriptional regulator [Rhodanobacter sp.]|nr:MAG: XRE family transcriptional regulator [Rhodanobacter sp.]TAL99241.1 MAG: XRE family transcriptional regulator [Rhodanobacter sp.]TAM42274.1 MAG: XRE family transcriptional regulator [Rhodanobacter sp.]
MRSTPILLATQLGDILRGARLSRGLTQTDIARELGISTQAVSKLENNAARASFERIHRLCQVLGLELLLQEKSAMNLRDAGTPEW